MSGVPGRAALFPAPGNHVITTGAGPSCRAGPAREEQRIDSERTPVHGTLHHVEVWVPDLGHAVESFGRLLEALGYTPFQHWENGRSWRLGETYLVFEQSPDLAPGDHDRRRPGLNHLAFHVDGPAAVDALTAEALSHGWRLLFGDRHPHAGGDGHYAAYLANQDGFEVELVAADSPVGA